MNQSASQYRFQVVALLCLVTLVPACAMTGGQNPTGPAKPPTQRPNPQASPAPSTGGTAPVANHQAANPQTAGQYPVRQTSGEEPVENPSHAGPAPGQAQGQAQMVGFPRHRMPHGHPQAASCPPGMNPSMCGPGGCPPYPGPGGYGGGYAEYLPPCWPEDEYLFDGGDRDSKVLVDPEFGLYGLHTEDTVGHFDTLDGRREVVPSNRVCVYAPRFAAVRKVYGLEQNRHNIPAIGSEALLRIQSQDTNLIASTANQPLQLGRDVGSNGLNTLEERQRGVGLDNRQQLREFQLDFKAYEDLAIIKLGQYDAGEKLRLANGVQNAIVWEHNLAAQVTIDGLTAVEAKSEASPQQTVHYDLPPGKPRLRVVKVASTGDAKVGEIIEFTLRFDNVGDQKIGNVTIVDNLTPRLELIEGSAQCSVDAEFLTQPNEKDSLVLRWEITDPLEVGEGGVIRFQCRVR
ncbi:MAG: hypothetical protein WDZ51_18465 [Pirellulaceae bacterium]